jgi:hypothetical protein
LQKAAPYELGGNIQTLNFVLYPVYLRGEAYLAAKQGAAAAAEFQKIIDHPAPSGVSPSALWRDWNLAVHWLSREIRPRQRLRIRNSSPFGKMLIPTFRSCGKPGRNTPCSIDKKTWERG